MTQKILVPVLTIGLLTASLTLAQERGKGEKGRGGTPTPVFSDIDTDESGGIDQDEWTAFQVEAAKERAVRGFAFLSGDDETITKEELAKIAGMRGGDKGGKGSKGGKGTPEPTTTQEKGKGSKGGKGEKGGKGSAEDTGQGVKPKRPEAE